jgi:Ni/Fe-hydrogenase b-type cytochrome subunit
MRGFGSKRELSDMFRLMTRPPDPQRDEQAATPAPATLSYRRHALIVRITHWMNVLALTILFMSGLLIFNEHPNLYWGKSSYTGAGPWLALERFPGWATLPSYQWLAEGRRWHFFFAWLLVFNGAVYVTYAFGSRHVTRNLLPALRDWRSIGRSLKDHLVLRHPTGEAAKHYNILQKLTYLIVIFGLLPFMVVTGLAMSPWLNSLFPGWVDLLGGRQSARTLHFIAAWALVAFVVIHVFEVIISGLWNNLRSMITGRYTFRAEARGESGGAQ